MARPTLFLGIDLSTQQLKAIVLSNNGELVKSIAINFSRDLPQYSTTDGVQFDKNDSSIVTAPVAMWLEALDVLLGKLSDSINIADIKGISGCAQQHGTVYWAEGGEQKLKNLTEKSFLQGLKEAFSIENSPIWMDSSTTEECRNMEKAIGGAKKMAEITGSRCHQRFSGSQIKKIINKEPEKWSRTEKVSLISSFICSLFCGFVTPIDLTDASGMNLMDIQSQKWSQSCLEAVSSSPVELIQKLGEPVDPSKPIGKVSHYLAQKYGFDENCLVLPFLGDNPASLAGLSLAIHDVAVSLGTSDTIFFTTKAFQPCIDAHILSHFSGRKDLFMGMICFKNGSLTRERIRRELNCSWQEFEELLSQTEPGNNGRIGIFFNADEIAPNVRRGDWRFVNGESIDGVFSKEVEARAVFESQCLLKRLYVQRKMGWSRHPEGRLLITGGASENRALAQILADVFRMSIFSLNVKDSAALGGAMRARHAILSPKVLYEEYYNNPQFNLLAQPDPKSAEIYDSMLNDFENVVEMIHKKAVNLE